MRLDKWFISNLDDSQRNIIVQDIDSNVIVSGSAGSGKTNLAIHRARLAKGKGTYAILILTIALKRMVAYGMKALGLDHERIAYDWAWKNRGFDLSGDVYCEVFGRSDEEGILVSVLLPIFSIISLFAVRTIHKTKIFNNEVLGSAILFVIAILLCIPLMFLINSQDPVARVFCLILTALVCALMHSCNFLLISCLPGRFASLGRSSTVGGVCNACTYIGASISSYGIALISNNGWRSTIIAFIVICGVGVIFALLAKEKYTAFLKESTKN
jgi:hypothetical protein